MMFCSDRSGSERFDAIVVADTMSVGVSLDSWLLA